MKRTWLCLPVVAAVVLGCDGEMGSDGGLDAAPGADGGFDAGGPTDGGTDAGPPMLDSGPDEMDAGMDAGSDGGADAGTDGGFDGGTDAGPECALGVDGALAIPDTVTARLAGASGNPSTSCTTDVGTGGPEAVYTLEVTTPTTVEITADSTFGVAVAIRAACDDPLSEVACGRSTAPMPGTMSAIVRASLDPGTYFVIVDTLGFGVGGDVTLSIDTFTPPAHSACGAAMPAVDGSAFAGEDLDMATSSAGECDGVPSNALYYSVVVPAMSGLSVTLSPAPPTFGMATFAVLDGCTGATCLAENTTYLNTTATDETVIVAVRGTGTVTVAFDLFAIAANGTCATARAITPSTPIVGDRTMFGGANPDTCFPGLAAEPTRQTLYYSVSVPAGDLLTVRATPAPVFEGLQISLLDGCTAATCLASAGTFPGAMSGALEAYYENTGASAQPVIIAVTGADPTAFDLAIGLAPAPTNDVCAMATTVTDGTTLPFEYVGSATDTRETACLPAATGPVVYYRASIPAGETLTVGASTIAGGQTSVRILNACAATTCLASGVGSAAFTNTRGTSRNVTIAVGIDPAPFPPGTPPDTFALSVAIGFPPYTESSIPAACIDMTGAPTLAGITTDDSTSAITALPFAFDFFGSAVTHYNATSNALVQLWPSAAGVGSTAYINVAIPTAAEPSNFIAAFWDDLVPGMGRVVTNTTGTAPNRVFTVQWTTFSLLRDAGSRLTFQAQLYETSDVIELHYCTLTPGTVDVPGATGGGATVGLENPGGTLGFQHSIDTAMSVGTVNGIRFTPR